MLWPCFFLLMGAEPSPTPLWSLQPLRRSEVPTVKTGQARHPIDALLEPRRTKAGLPPQKEADRHTLVVRLYLDLLGLPPSAEEAESFVRDTDPGAYGRLVEKLLSDRRHGEHWARHWLDVARYADSKGYAFLE